MFAAGAPRGKVLTSIHFSGISIVREERPIRMLQTVSLFNRLYNIMIEIKIYRIRIGLHYGRQLKIKGIDFLNLSEFLIVMSLLLTAGIERNPGPLSEDSYSSTASGSFLDN